MSALGDNLSSLTASIKSSHSQEESATSEGELSVNYLNFLLFIVANIYIIDTIYSLNTIISVSM